MNRDRWLRWAVSVALLIVACGESSTGPVDAVARVEVFAGAGQRFRVGQPLPEPVVVRLVDAGGSPVVGATVTFVPEDGHGSVDPWATRSDSAGLAATTWTLGKEVGDHLLVVMAREGVSTEIRATAVAGFPDLVVTRYPASVVAVPGSTFEYTVEVRNRGDVAASATHARIFLSPDSVVTTADEIVGAPSDVPTLGTGESTSMAGSYTVRSSEAIGTVLWLGACVDAVTDEVDTANNCSAAIKVTVVVPDLVTRVSPASVTVAAGGSFEYVAVVRNVGDGPAAATRSRTFQSPDSVITIADEVVGEPSDVPALDPGEFASRVASITTSSSAAPGTVVYVGECVDPAEGELDVGNNCSAAIKVTVTGQPDLVASVSPDSVVVWVYGYSVLFKYEVEIRNRGKARAPATRTRAYLSPDTVVTISDEVVGKSSPVPSLGPGEAVRGTIAMEVSGSAAPGTVYLGECVDPVQGEPDTANNCSAALKLVIRAPQGGRRPAESLSRESSRIIRLSVHVEFMPVARASPAGSASGCGPSLLSRSEALWKPAACRSKQDLVQFGGRLRE